MNGVCLSGFFGDLTHNTAGPGTPIVLGPFSFTGTAGLLVWKANGKVEHVEIRVLTAIYYGEFREGKVY